MRRVAEMMYIVESEREEFLKGALNPTPETEQVLWMCGVRKQQYFALNEYIFMTFEYSGNDFSEDMTKMATYLNSNGMLIQKRRKDVPEDQRTTTNWWAPVKSLGTLLEHKPETLEQEKWRPDYMAQVDGSMSSCYVQSDMSYDENEWTSGMDIW